MEITSKLNFIQTGFLTLIKKLDTNTMGKWGKMNAQQMVEHVSDFFKVSSDKLIFPLQTPQEHLPKFREFLLSEKEFRENTKAPEAVLSENPLPLRHTNFEDACEELRNEVMNFTEYFKKSNPAKTTHPVFGPLDFNEWVCLHYKHLLHHAKQFNLV